MAILSRGISLGSTETVTNTKLHNLVDLGTISGIVDADIAANAQIQFSKLLASSISGALFTNLPLVPSAAGLLPFANLPVPFGSSYVSLVSIPNASLVPLTLASWVDGAAMRNLQSMPSTAGQFSWYNLVQSLASGSSIQYNGVNSFVGGTGTTNYAAGSYLTAVLPRVTLTATPSSSFVKQLEMIVPRGGTLTIKFFLCSPAANGNMQGRIYRNGSAVGTLQTDNTVAGNVFSEDISGWTAGDLLQLYGTGNDTQGAVIGNLEIYENVPVKEAYAIATYGTPRIIRGASLGIAPPTGLGAQGDMFLRDDGSTSTTLYVKTGASTWTAK